MSNHKPDFKTESAEDHGGKVSVPPQRRMGRLAWTALVTGVLCATFLFSLDITIVATVQPRIVHDLGEIEKFAWISVGFNLGAASANLCWAKLFGQFENKILFLVALLLFEAGSVVCGAAPTMNALIVGRVLCGLGGNGLYIGTMKILSNLTTIRERPLYIAYFGIIWGLGVVLGPIIGGAFVSNPHAGWRWSFYINVCVAAIFAPVYLMVLPAHHPQPGLSTRERLKRLDFPGAALFIAAYTAGIMAISFGGAMFAWSSATTVALFCTSSVLLVLFIIQQAFTDQAYRLFPAHLLISWENWILFAQTAASITILFLPIYFIPLYFQFVHGFSPLKASVFLLPFVCVSIVLVLLNGGLMRVFGYYKPWYLFGSALAIIGSALMRTITAESDFNNVFGYTVLLAGVGAFVQAGIPVMQAKYPPKEISNVLAFMSCAQRTGLAIGFAVANAVFINEATDRIATILPHAPSRELQAAIAGATSLSVLNLSNETRERVLTALATSIDKIYDMSLASACFCLALALFLRNERLFIKQQST